MAWTVEFRGRLLFSDKPTDEQIRAALKLIDNDGFSLAETSYNQPQPFNMTNKFFTGSDGQKQ